MNPKEQFINEEEAIAILLKGIPICDVRAEVEYLSGTIPGAINLPILIDSERAQVGTAYKQLGKEAAVELGLKLTASPVKEARIAVWQNFFQDHPQSFLFCFRGGMRSEYAQNWLRESGIQISRLKGGYKIFRRYLMHQNLESPSLKKFLVLSSRTGSGKTDLIHALGGIRPVIDLEDIAKHRGSSFGGTNIQQPTQLNFENQLALQLKKSEHEPSIIIEDESRMIGNCCLPESVYKHKNISPVVLIESPIEDRAKRILVEYIHSGIQVWGAIETQKKMQEALSRIKTKLGGVSFDEISKLLSQAFWEANSEAQEDQHLKWIRLLLERYYDPLYDYNLPKKTDRIQFKGTYQETYEYLKKG